MTKTPARWFVVNFIPRHPNAKPETYVEHYNRDHANGLELFAPKLHTPSVSATKINIKERPLTYHYVFLRGTLEHVKRLCTTPDNGFSLLLDPGSEHHYGIVSDEAMESFMIIARMHDNTLPFYDIHDIALEEGDLVKIVGGPYAGLTGTFLPRHRSNKGNLVIAANSNVGSIVWEVDAKYIRILKFAHNSHRQYDILDAFIPRLFPILRKFYHGTPFDEKEKSQLQIFNQRMGAVVPDNHKLEAKLTATLLCVQEILGDVKHIAQTRSRYERCCKSITNLWTQALVTLLFSIPVYSLEPLRDTMSQLPPPQTAAAAQLLQEYNYYLSE